MLTKSKLHLSIGLCLLTQMTAGLDKLPFDYLPINDTIQPSGYGINPSALPESSSNISLLSGLSSEKTSLVDSSRNFELYNKTTASSLGLILSTNAIGGLGLGLNLYQTEETDLSSRDMTELDDGVRESFLTQGANLRAVFELAPKLNLGAILRILSVTNTVVGTFNANSNNNANRTRYNALLIGPGVGANVNWGMASFGLAYLQAMRSSSKIRGEEKIISEPGVVEVSLAAKNPPWAFALGIRRLIYDKDERGQGSTLNDENLTAINLFGLNPNRNRLFLVDEQAIGVDYNWSNQMVLHFSLTQDSLAYSNYLDAVPVSGSAQLVNYWSGAAHATITHDKLSLNLGIKAHRGTSHVSNSPEDLAYKADSRSYLLGLSTKF